MSLEIERKFLVHPLAWETLQKPKPNVIKQGYLSTDPNKTIRVRLNGERGFLTIKGKGNGLTRPEFEYEISKVDAEALLANFVDSAIEKYRYDIFVSNKKWEVDVFFGLNEGLIVAEIELNHEDEQFEIPNWVANEVTFEEKYYNANLISKPYLKW